MVMLDRDGTVLEATPAAPPMFGPQTDDLHKLRNVVHALRANIDRQVRAELERALAGAARNLDGIAPNT